LTFPLQQYPTVRRRAGTNLNGTGLSIQQFQLISPTDSKQCINFQVSQRTQKVTPPLFILFMASLTNFFVSTIMIFE
jgi:hypothetical protein